MASLLLVPPHSVVLPVSRQTTQRDTVGDGSTAEDAALLLSAGAAAAATEQQQQEVRSAVMDVVHSAVNRINMLPTQQQQAALLQYNQDCQ